MAFLVKAIIKAAHLRFKFAMKRVNGIIERIKMAAISCLMVFVAGQDQLLKLAQYVDLAFHLLLSFSECLDFF